MVLNNVLAHALKDSLPAGWCARQCPCKMPDRVTGRSCILP